MKKDFKLLKVLEYRERKLELEKKKLTELEAKLRDTNFSIEKVLSDIDKNMTDMKDPNNFQFIKIYELYIEKLEKELEELNDLRKRLEIDIEKQKKIVVNAMNDVKVMEKLKDKHIKNYLMYLNKEEMKIIDELVVTRFNNENF